MTDEHFAGWTKDRIERLATLWADGLSASEIALELGGGVTRNGVIGKVHRLKLAGRPTPLRLQRSVEEQIRHAQRRLAKVRRARQTNAGALATKLKYAPPKFATAPLPFKEAWKPLPGSSPLSLLELTDKVCRWPIGENKPFTFCGCATVAGSSYCKDHAATSRGFPTVFPVNNTNLVFGSDTSQFHGAGSGKKVFGGRVDTQELSTQ